jgi:superfamily II DNA or RNA helicase/HKD family nuclease
MRTLPPGLYERLLTFGLRDTLDGAPLAPQLEPLDAAEAPHHLARHLGQLVAAALRGVEGVDAQLAVANRVVEVLAEALPERVDGGDRVTSELVVAVAEPDALAREHALVRPATPLTQTHLFINARGEHTVGSELARELASADRVDLLCSFLMWSGYLRLRPALRALLQRGRPLRVLTTVYCGATERRVLDALHADGARIKVSYDTRRTRLHAKAWLLGRESGFTTAFIGSSNLSAPALADGLEWNVRVGQDAPAVLQKFAAAFETYWNDPAFEEYDPARDAARFDQAIGRGEGASESAVFAGLLVQPYPFQQGILDALDVERRVHGRWRNLVVAATGTGKTVIAALDYRRLRRMFVEMAGRPPRLLFVAHRKEILDQSRAVFRQVLQDAGFGGRFVDGERPLPGQDVFASVQSLARLDPASIAPDAWDVVIVDEFHHAEAPTYTRLLERLQPWVLLGLTATPERGDGRDVTRWFGGHVAAELRLWDAIERGLLAPFQYFGLRDPVDASPYWVRGRYDLGELDRVYSGHHARARRIAEAVADHVADPRRMRAVGFCVGVAHARFMAARFEEHFAGLGVRARALVGGDDDREGALRDLREGRLQALFTVDLLNEGVDVPEIDTVLFLRPTESATVFLQQLGRGLRLAEGKRALTVLDFIGTADRAFRFDLRYRALVGGSRASLAEHVEQGFPVLPAGCSITLDEDSAGVVLANLRAALSPRQDRLVRELRELGAGVSLADFLAHTGLDPEEIYRKRTFTDLKRLAGFPIPAAGPGETGLLSAVPRLLHADDPAVLDAAVRFLAGAPGPLPPALRVLLVTLLGPSAVTDPDAAAVLWETPALRAELVELFEVLRGRVAHVPLPLATPAVPLAVHSRYRREQVYAAFGKTLGQGTQPGVWYHEPSRADVFFVTLQKSEKDYSPSTMYEDYALSPDRFHWQTQAATTQASRTARRYRNHRDEGVTPLLFVRTTKRDARGETSPFLFLGPVDFVAWSGEKPISIEWALRHPIPADAYAEMRVTA